MISHPQPPSPPNPTPAPSLNRMKNNDRNDEHHHIKISPRLLGQAEAPPPQIITVGREKFGDAQCLEETQEPRPGDYPLYLTFLLHSLKTCRNFFVFSLLCYCPWPPPTSLITPSIRVFSSPVTSETLPSPPTHTHTLPLLPLSLSPSSLRLQREKQNKTKKKSKQETYFFMCYAK